MSGPGFGEQLLSNISVKKEQVVSKGVQNMEMVVDPLLFLEGWYQKMILYSVFG